MLEDDLEQVSIKTWITGSGTIYICLSGNFNEKSAAERVLLNEKQANVCVIHKCFSLKIVKKANCFLMV